MISHLLLVGAGGAVGAISRYFVGIIITRAVETDFPLATLAVNVIGSAFAGAALARFGLGASPDNPWRLFIAVGVLGGFTTYSAFSVETLSMIQSGRALPAILNVAANTVLSLAAAWVGYAIATGSATTAAGAAP